MSLPQGHLASPLRTHTHHTVNTYILFSLPPKAAPLTVSILHTLYDTANTQTTYIYCYRRHPVTGHTKLCTTHSLHTQKQRTSRCMCLALPEAPPHKMTSAGREHIPKPWCCCIDCGRQQRCHTPPPQNPLLLWWWCWSNTLTWQWWGHSCCCCCSWGPPSPLPSPPRGVFLMVAAVAVAPLLLLRQCACNGPFCWLQPM